MNWESTCLLWLLIRLDEMLRRLTWHIPTSRVTHVHDVRCVCEKNSYIPSRLYGG